MLEPKKDAAIKSQNVTAVLTEGTEKIYNSNATNNINMPPMTDTIYGMQIPVIGFRTMKKLTSPTVVRSDTDYDPGSYLNSNSVKTPNMVYKKGESYAERLRTLCDSLTLQTSSSLPSDCSNDGTVQLGTTDSFTTDYLATACANEDAAEETVVPDVSAARGRCSA